MLWFLMTAAAPEVMTIVGVLIIAMGIFVYRITHKNKVKQEIAKEKRLVEHYRKEIETSSGNLKSAKTVVTVRIGKSDMADCPYCGRRFSVKDGTCPSCGATATVTGDEIVVTKIEENQEILKALEYGHKEKLEALKNERSAKRNENLLGFLFVAILGVGFIYIMSLTFRK